MSEAEKVTLKVNPPTKKKLEAFQFNQFKKTGKRLTNDEAISLMVKLADPEAVELADLLIEQEANGRHAE
jgi:hypothetical protein